MAELFNWKLDVVIFEELNMFRMIEYKGHRGRDHMVIGFIATCTMSAYHQ